MATHAVKRVVNLQVGSPDRLRLRGVLYTDDPHRLEAGYHRAWRHLRRHGEWFEIDDELRDVIDTLLFGPDLDDPPAAILFHPGARPRGKSILKPFHNWYRDEAEFMAAVERACAENGLP